MRARGSGVGVATIAVAVVLGAVGGGGCGVDQDNLEVRVDNNVLTLRGMAHHIAPGDAVYREYELVNFFRQFELGEKIDQSNIAAALKQGVLTVHLPKAPEAQPRKITVSVA